MIEVMDEEKNKIQQTPVDTSQSISDRKLEAKVTYKYPEKREFRFPIIPDHEPNQVHISDEQFEIPAYLRNERSLHRFNNEDSATSEQTERKMNKEEPTQKTKVPVKSNRFTPTDVPSPIYGYNRRKNERDLHQTPAYVRRQMRTEYDATEKETAASHVEVMNEPLTKQKERDERIEQEAHIMEKEVKQMPTTTKSTDEQDSESVMEVLDVEQGQDSSIESRDKGVKQHAISPSIQQRTNQEKEKDSSAEADIPFNVMMTRQDKMRFERQQKKKKFEHVEKKTVEREEIDYSIPMHLLNDPVNNDGLDSEWLEEQQHLLEETFVHFNVNATVVNVTQGPSVTRFEVQPALGVKVSKVRNLSDDIKLNLSAKDIRIEAPIPGKNTIGIEIPNLNSQTVGLYEILHGNDFMNSRSALPIGLGVTIEGEPLITDVASMPHGLIAGATGSGKSVCINTILLSLLYRNHYDDLKLMLIDPKMVELTPYNGIPHLVSPVITDVKAATAALKWAVDEMESRYEKFVEEGVRDIHRYNSTVVDTGREDEKMPYMVIVIDELADLMMVAPQDVEDYICRIAQKARACGMHLLIATQRPSVDVITGLIKANVPTRIAFSVSSQVDSRTIIDTNGAERLLGKGDMLFVENGKGKSIRLQGAFVSDEEIDRVVQMVKETGPAQYLFEEEQLLEMTTEMDDDPLLEEVVSFIVEQQSASTSMLQRQFRVGYNRAARLMQSLEQKGIISGQNGSKPRDILMRK